MPNFGYNWAPFPTVTASGKACVSPIAEQITGRPTDKDFEPSLKREDKPLSTHNFRKLLHEAGWQILKGFETGDPGGSAWIEDGKASLAVLDDDQEGTAAMVVVVDTHGSVIVKQNTVVGG